MSSEEKVYEARFWFYDPLPEYIAVWPFKTNWVSGHGHYHSLQPQPSGITLRIITSGRWIVNMHDKTYEAVKGDMFYALPSEKIEFSQTGENISWEWLEIQFSGPAAVDFMRQFGLTRTKAAITLNDPALAEQTFYLMHEHIVDPARTVSRQLELMFRLVGAVGKEPSLDSYIRNDTHQELVASVIDYINSLHRLDSNVSQLAERFGVDRTTLCRAFKKVTGMPAHQFIDQQRFMLAQDLLSSTFMPIDSIAAIGGFTDVKYFTTWFKSKTGMPPGKWRNRIKKS
jgi:AraC-like DNA-binding protein